MAVRSYFSPNPPPSNAAAASVGQPQPSTVAHVFAPLPQPQPPSSFVSPQPNNPPAIASIYDIAAQPIAPAAVATAANAAQSFASTPARSSLTPSYSPMQFTPTTRQIGSSSVATSSHPSSVSKTPVAPDALPPTFLTLFGFPPVHTSYVLSHFASLYPIANIVTIDCANGNWVVVEVKHEQDARNAVLKNGTVLNIGGEPVMIGIMLSRMSHIKSNGSTAWTPLKSTTKKKRFPIASPSVAEGQPSFSVTGTPSLAKQHQERSDFFKLASNQSTRMGQRGSLDDLLVREKENAELPGEMPSTRRRIFDDDEFRNEHEAQKNVSESVGSVIGKMVETVFGWN